MFSFPFNLKYSLIFFVIPFKKIIYYYYFLLYNTVLVLPYIDMNLPRVYMSSQSIFKNKLTFSISVSIWLVSTDLF